MLTQIGPNSLHLSIINIISTSTNLLKDPFFTTKCLTEMIFPYKITRTCLVILDKSHTDIYTESAFPQEEDTRMMNHNQYRGVCFTFQCVNKKDD